MPRQRSLAVMSLKAAMKRPGEERDIEIWKSDGRLDRAQIYACEFQVRKQHSRGHWWIEPGPDLPEGVEVVAGATGSNRGPFY